MNKDGRKTPDAIANHIYCIFTKHYEQHKPFLTWWDCNQKCSREKELAYTKYSGVRQLLLPQKKKISLFYKISFYLKCLSGLSKVLMRLTIQLKRRPYSALAIASLTSVAFSTVLGRIIVSPRVTTQ